MQVHLTGRFLKAFDDAPAIVKKVFRKQAELLAINLHHPSLHAKKYNEADDIWQARVNRDWRFYFRIKDNICYIIDIIPHPK